MNRMVTAAVVLSIAIVGLANAQIFDRLKRETSKTLKKEVLGDKADPAKAEGKSEPGAQSAGHPPAHKGGDRKYPPGSPSPRSSTVSSSCPRRPSSASTTSRPPSSPATTPPATPS